MKKIKFERDDNFVTMESLIFAVTSLITVQVFGIIYLLFFILVFLCFVVLINLVNARIKELKKRLRQANAISNFRLNFIKRLITLSFHTDKVLFHRKFISIVHIKELRRAGVVDINSKLLHKKIRGHMAESNSKMILTDSDIELYCLLAHGFTPSEITIIYNLKNINSAYMKRHRLKGKLENLGL